MTKNEMLKIAFEKRAESDFPFASDKSKGKVWYNRMPGPELVGATGLLQIANGISVLDKSTISKVIGGTGIGLGALILGAAALMATPKGRQVSDTLEQRRMEKSPIKSNFIKEYFSK
jgi:hypothetical protein